MLLCGGCLPGDPGKELSVINNCGVDVRVRVREGSNTDVSDIPAHKPPLVRSGETVNFSVFDHSGLTIAVSRVEASIGKSMPIPYSTEDHLEFVLPGEACSWVIAGAAIGRPTSVS